MPLPLSGGSSSNENTVLFADFILSIMLILEFFLTAKLDIFFDLDKFNW